LPSITTYLECDERACSAYTSYEKATPRVGTDDIRGVAWLTYVGNPRVTSSVNTEYGLQIRR